MILNLILAQAAAAADSLATNLNIDAAISSISKLTVSEIVKYLTDAALSIGFAIIKVALIWFIGRWLSKRLISLAKTMMSKKNTDASIQTFLVSFIDIVALIVLLIIIISVVGIDTSSFIALFASAGVAIGMALSGTLQNFAGGVMILLFRPYKVGEFIEAQGVSGTVKEIQIFNTVVVTGDNKQILLPNGPVSTGIITNYSRENMRRVDLSYSISYGDDYEVARAVLLRLAGEDARIQAKPNAPFVALGALSASSIDVTLRVWCKQEDYWGVLNDMNKKVYEAFPKAGLKFPYQTFTLHVNNEK